MLWSIILFYNSIRGCSKFFWWNNYGCFGLQIHELITRKIEKLAWFKKKSRKCEKWDRLNDIDISDGSPNQYVGPDKVFWEINLDAPMEFAHFLKRTCKCENMLEKMVLVYRMVPNSIWSNHNIFFRKKI